MRVNFNQSLFHRSLTIERQFKTTTPYTHSNIGPFTLSLLLNFLTVFSIIFSLLREDGSQEEIKSPIAS
jgi:hypothetical protein